MACTCTCCCGACCYPDGTCAVTLESECVLPVGTFQDKGTTCDPNPCESPVICAGEQCYYYSDEPSGGGTPYWIKNLDCVSEDCECESPAEEPTGVGEFTFIDCYQVSPP